MQPQLSDDLLDIIIKLNNRLEIVEKALTNDAVQVGTEIFWPASAGELPFNYHIEDGSALDRIGFAALFQLIGTDYGVGDGSTTFNIPNRADTWHVVGAGGEPAFQNSWANSSVPSYGSLRFRKGADGMVAIQGVINAGTTGSVIFTLPTGYRPSVSSFYRVLGDSDTAGHYIQIDPTGNVFGTRSGSTLYLGTILSDAGTSSDGDWVIKTL